MAQLTTPAREDLLARGFSRRALLRAATLLGAGATLPFYDEPALAQLSGLGRLPADAVRLNANENPLGPCPEALEALYKVARAGGRYYYEEAAELRNLIAAQEELPVDCVMVFAGSSPPLHQTILAFTSPTRSFVTPDPTFEAGVWAARYIGAKVITVPLRPDFSHDVKAMAAADPEAGVLYVCTPNNPTGTLTSKEDVDWLVAHKPAGSVVLLDEAYIHYTDAPPCTHLIKADKDVILLRTFSKIYGMAGLRAGYALARPDLLAKLRMYNAGGLPTTAMVAAQASLKSKSVVPARRALNRQIRDSVFEFLEQQKLRYVASEANMFMLDAGRPAQELVRALAARNVYIGRVWPAWPNHCRVTIGTREEMKRFQEALREVL